MELSAALGMVARRILFPLLFALVIFLLLLQFLPLSTALVLGAGCSICILIEYTAAEHERRQAAAAIQAFDYLMYLGCLSAWRLLVVIVALSSIVLASII